jgi:hypothetical protein
LRICVTDKRLLYKDIIRSNANHVLAYVRGLHDLSCLAMNGLNDADQCSPVSQPSKVVHRCEGSRSVCGFVEDVHLLLRIKLGE